MKRNEFLFELDKELEGLPQQVRSEMLRDYDEHFGSGLEQGRTEAEIAESLGDPHILGRELKSQYVGGSVYNAPPPRRPSFSIMHSLFMTLGLGMFNLIFVLGPYLGLAGILIGLWAAAFGLSLSGVVVLIVSVFPFIGDAHLLFTDSGLSFMTITTGSVALTALGLLFGIGCWYVTKAYFKLTVKYLSWNFKRIIGRRY